MKMPVLGNIRCAMICLPSLHTPGPTQTNPNHLHLLRNYAKMLLRKASTLLLLPVHLLLLPVHLAVLLLPAVLLHSLARTRLNNVYIYIFFFCIGSQWHGSKPLTRSKISEISQWQKCFSELKISNPRISCTLNGVRRSTWKVVRVTKPSYASETSFKW